MHPLLKAQGCTKASTAQSATKRPLWKRHLTVESEVPIWRPFESILVYDRLAKLDSSKEPRASACTPGISCHWFLDPSPGCRFDMAPYASIRKAQQDIVHPISNTSRNHLGGSGPSFDFAYVSHDELDQANQKMKIIENPCHCLLDFHILFLNKTYGDTSVLVLSQGW